MIFISPHGPIVILNDHHQKAHCSFCGRDVNRNDSKIAKMIGADFSGWKGIYQLEKLKNGA